MATCHTHTQVSRNLVETPRKPRWIRTLRITFLDRRHRKATDVGIFIIVWTRGSQNIHGHACGNALRWQASPKTRIMVLASTHGHLARRLGLARRLVASTCRTAELQRQRTSLAGRHHLGLAGRRSCSVAECLFMGVMPVQHALTCAVVQDALAEDPFEAGFTTCTIWV